jgi:CRP/FNR family transcriptional regulator, cyclic AMP receptor protein
MNADELKSIAVLQTMDRDARSRLAEALEQKGYTEGQTVFAEGDPGDSMYFIVSGCIRIEKRAQAAAASSKTLAVLECGDYFGEMALLDQKPRSAAAVAAGPVKVLRLSKAAFDALQQGGGRAGLDVLFAMIRTSSERIRRLSAQLVVYDEVGKAIGEARDLQALLDVIVQQLVSATGADWGLLVLRSEFSEQLDIRGQVNLSLTPDQRQAVSLGHGLLATFLQNPQDHIVSHFGTDETYRSAQRLGFETESILLAAITLPTQFLGVILLGGQPPDHFDLNALNLVRGIARQAAQAILNARHREEQEAKSRHSRQYVRF